MSRMWKILIAASLALNVFAQLQLYVLNHPNPYSQERKELMQLQLDVSRLKEALNQIAANQEATLPHATAIK